MFDEAAKRMQLIKANIGAGMTVAKKQCCANILIRNNNGKQEILLLKRSSLDSFWPGTFCCPGGGIDVGERYLEAVKRETTEETGITEDQYQIVKYTKISVPKAELHYFVSLLYENDSPIITLDESEHENYVWASMKQWLNMDLILELKDHLMSILSIKNIIY